MCSHSMIIQFWIWSPRNTGKTPSYPAHFRIAAFGCQRAYCPSSFSLEPCLQLCIHKLLSESSTSVLSANVLRRNTYFHFVLQRVCMSSRHRGQLSVAVEVVTNSSRSDLVFTKASLSSGDCSDNSTDSHIFDSAWRLSSQRCVSIAHTPV